MPMSDHSLSHSAEPKQAFSGFDLKLIFKEFKLIKKHLNTHKETGINFTFTFKIKKKNI